MPHILPETKNIINNVNQRTMTKEQILEQVANDKSYSSWGECMYDTHEHSQIEYTCEAMELYAKQEVAKEREKAKKLVEALNEYIVLLGEELDEVMGFVNAHQWESTRFEQGKILREKIKQSLTEYEKL